MRRVWRPTTKLQPPTARNRKCSRDDIHITVDSCTVQCRAGQFLKLRLSKDASREAQFGTLCHDSPLPSKRTESKAGRTVYGHPTRRTLDRKTPA